MVFTQDVLGRVASVRRSGVGLAGTPESLAVATYAYHPLADTLASVTAGNGQKVTYVRDDFGRLESVSGYATGTAVKAVKLVSDPRGNVVKRTHGAATVTYGYDGLDRLVVVTGAVSGASVTYRYVYDEPWGRGRLTSVVGPTGTTTLEYDAAGRLARETVQESGIAAPLVTEYGYDADGDLTSVRYPTGLRVGYGRDPATKEVREVRDLDGPTVYAADVQRWPFGPLRSFTFGNGAPFAREVNQRYETVALTSGPLGLGYVRDAAGGVSAIGDGAATRVYRYDFLDRLAAFSPGHGAGEAFSATYAGTVTDRLTQTSVQGPLGVEPRHAFAYDDQRNVSNVGLYWPKTSGKSGIQLAYCLRHDPLGRMTLVGTTSPAGPGTTACTSDTSVQTPLARFRYDASNRRVARWLASTGEWTWFAHAPGGDLLGELVQQGTALAPRREYVWLDGLPIAQIEHVAGVRHVYAVHAEDIGLPTRLTNRDRQVVWSATSMPYGDVVEATTPDPVTGRTVVTNLRLPGQYDERLLASVGLQGPYYNWNRWYLPGVGRYLELDPVALKGRFNSAYGVDWYNYAGGNPLSNTDPRGLYWAPPPPPLWPLVPAGACGAGVGYGLRKAFPKIDDWVQDLLDDVLGPPGPNSKLVTCRFLSAGGKGPAPGERMRCTYTCSDGGNEWQVERHYAVCPDEITVRVP